VIAMTWILFASLLLTACGIAASLGLAYSMKRQLWQARHEMAKSNEEHGQRAKELEQRFASLSGRFEELEQHTGMLVAPAPTLSGLNLTKRTQALRMLARGDAAASIAAALSLPRAEAELLVKVRRLEG
jgi:hypothetical protein